jgi:heme exporter protein B
VAASAHGMSAEAHLSLLAAVSLLSLVLAPLATAAALRISLE